MKKDVILRSRVRLARNIKDYPFPPVLNDVCRKEIITKVANAIQEHGFSEDSSINDDAYAHMLSEENLISREFAAEKETHALNNNVFIMVCEEDHLRIQSFADGSNLFKAGQDAFEAEKILSEKINFAFNNDLGYLTRCPTNLGTAMRASVMMFLPALTLSKRMGEVKSELEKIGMTIRGMYGEGSSADAYMYQISNRLSLGISEEDLLRKTETVAKRIENDEIDVRTALFNANKDALTDKIFRSFGTIKFAHIISSKEFLDCYAYVRLGISLGLISDLTTEKLDKLLYDVMPAHILKSHEAAGKSATERDKIRAQIIKSTI